MVEEEPLRNLLKVNPEVGRLQQEKLRKVKKGRDNAKVNKTLKDIECIARGEENLMPAMLEAVRNYATLGEIADVLRGVFGEYREA
jgi:methylmalonyl-CoA mutase N-terminal domain/subunit